MSVTVERTQVDWVKIVERLTWAAVTISMIIYGTGQHQSREYNKGQVDSCRGVVYMGKSQSYYDGAQDQIDLEFKEREGGE